MPLGYEYFSIGKPNEPLTHYVYVYHQLRLDPHLTPAMLAWKLPVGALPERDEAFKLLNIGENAPPFRLPTVLGEPFDLTQALSQHKAVLLNFWALWCGPCREELPQLEQLYRQLQGQGVAIVAINLGDKPEALKKYIHDQHFTLPVAQDELVADGNGFTQTARLYGVQVFPTTYILDQDGKVKACVQGADRSAILQALASLGFLHEKAK